MRRSYRSTSLFTLLAVCLATASVPAADRVQGMLTTDGCTGQKDKPHGWIGERLYVGQLDTGFGSGSDTTHQPAGWYAIPGDVQPPGFPGGTYALFALQYDGAPAFTYDMGLKLPGGAEVLDHTRLNSVAHYSVMYDMDYKAWGESPWIQHDDFYQTFVATTPHVTRFATKLADKTGDHYYMTLNFAIYETNDGPPSKWKRISPVRSRFLSTGTDPIIHIFWVPFQSQEVKLTPGKTYAGRLWRDPSSQSDAFSLVVRRDKGDGYKRGHLFLGDKAHEELDAYAYISGGEDGTVVNYAPVESFDLKDLIGGGRRFGQTFKAGGTSIAGVDVIYATGEARPARLPVTIQVYDKPEGKPIGPAKKCYGVPGSFQGRAAVIWKRGEVPVEPGRTYYVEWSSTGCNTWKTNEDLPGEAYVDGELKKGADLALSIAEYVGDAAQSRPAR